MRFAAGVGGECGAGRGGGKGGQGAGGEREEGAVAQPRARPAPRTLSYSYPLYNGKEEDVGDLKAQDGGRVGQKRRLVDKEQQREHHQGGAVKAVKVEADLQRQGGGHVLVHLRREGSRGRWWGARGKGLNRLEPVRKLHVEGPAPAEGRRSRGANATSQAGSGCSPKCSDGEGAGC